MLDKLRALLTTALIGRSQREHAWRMATLEKGTLCSIDTDEPIGSTPAADMTDEAIVPHPSIPGAYLKLEGFAPTEVRKPKD